MSGCHIPEKNKVAFTGGGDAPGTVIYSKGGSDGSSAIAAGGSGGIGVPLQNNENHNAMIKHLYDVFYSLQERIVLLEAQVKNKNHEYKNEDPWHFTSTKPLAGELVIIKFQIPNHLYKDYCLAFFDGNKFINKTSLADMTDLVCSWARIP